MTDNEINEVVSRLLQKQFEDLAFEFSTVQSEEDFDGSSVLRVVAHFKGGHVPAKRLIDAGHNVQTELLRHDERRFVFLDSAFPNDHEFVDEDLE